MNDDTLTTLDEVRHFLAGTAVVDLVINAKAERYAWIQQTLVRFDYRSLSKADKGLLLSFLQKVSSYSRIQIKRLAKQHRQTGRLRRSSCPARGFVQQYTDADRRLLARVDELHGTLSGPATKKLCERAHALFGQTEYQRLSGISVAHLYITCATGRPTVPCGGTSRKPVPRPRRSANGGRQNLKANPGFCVWTRSTRAIRMAAKGRTT